MPRLEDTVLGAHTREPITVITQRYLSVLRSCGWSKHVRHQKSALFGSLVLRETRLDILYKSSQTGHNNYGTTVV